MTEVEKRNTKGDAGQNINLFLPGLALLFDVMPFILGILYAFTPIFGVPILGTLTLIALVLSPVIGMILGVVILCRGKSVYGRGGRIAGIIAILLPLLYIAAVLIFLFGVLPSMVVQM